MTPRQAELELICRSALSAARPELHASAVRVSFYPYIGLSHTIRRRGGSWEVRLSDHCADAPRGVLEAIVAILVSRVVRRRPPRLALERYARFRREPAILERVRRRRLVRGRKQIDLSPGRFHELREVFRELSARHFAGQVEVTRLGWGPRPSWTRLGHYDPVHETITISPVLDSPRVPRSAVAFIVYHEMLHAVFEPANGCGRRRDHPPEFRRAERAFPEYAAARRFLREYCRDRQP